MSRSSAAVIGMSALATASLLLAGCSSPDGGGGGGELTYEDSPLYKYSMALYGGSADEDVYIKQANEVEELVAICMAGEGFEYVPVDQSQYMSFGSDDMEDRNTEEWVAANGYGYNQTDEQMAEQQAQFEDYVDPNQDYVMSLSESEQMAYYEVLQGPQPTEEEMNDPEFQYQQLGCQGEANTEVRGEQLYEDPEYKDLIASMQSLWEKQQELPEIKKLDADWSSCMADAGHADLATKNAVYDVMNAQNEEAYASMDGQELSSEKRAEMREFEIDLALADFHCTEDLNYTEVSLKAQFALEEQFIADNKAALDAMLAAVEKGE